VWSFASQNPGGGAALAAPSALTLVYGTGAVALTGLAFDATSAATYAVTPAVPFSGAVGTAPASNGDQEFVKVAVTASVPNTQVVFTGSPGTWFDADGAGIADIGAKGTGLTPDRLSVVANGSGVAEVWVTSTKTGAQTFTATSTSGSSVSGSITYVNAEAAARNVAVSADPTNAQIGSGSTVAVAVTDVFGNAVQLLPGGPTVTLQTSLGSLAGGVSIFTLTTTNAAGRATVSLVSPVAGVAIVGALGTGGQFANKVDVPFTGAPAAVDKAAVNVTFSSQADKSIMIEGTRGNNENANRVYVEGRTTGLAGRTVTPYYRFPGQVGFTAGVGTRTVSELGNFTWQRKTGKRIGVQFRHETIISNSIIIAAK
jgi:hypothetical protein